MPELDNIDDDSVDDDDADRDVKQSIIPGGADG